MALGLSGCTLAAPEVKPIEPLVAPSTTPSDTPACRLFAPAQLPEHRFHNGYANASSCFWLSDAAGPVVVSLREAPVQRLEDLSRLSLAVPRSFPVPESLAGLDLQWVNSNEHAIRMLVGRRVDAAYGSNLGLFGAARGLGLRMQVFAQPLVVERQSFWLHLSRRNATAQLIERLARAVESLHRDGSITRLYEQALREFGDDRMPA